ncbi:GYF domain-containing protein [Parvibaculaceae bacterium PLY_AMNH_Bact1]|nr:GYF domain-containing protein [Parvibaculaceae bacterium PLY_AMNH_Bact1]
MTMQNSADQMDDMAPEAQADVPEDRVLADGHWSLKHGEEVYGPYTFEAMETYIAEGRVAGHSVIAPSGTEDWTEAKDVAMFAGFFDEEKSKVTASTPSHPQDRRTVYGPKKGQVDRRKRPDTSNFLIITDVKSRHGATLEQSIMSLGAALKVANNAWVVNCKGTAPGLLNQLSKVLSSQDGLFIADATRDRTAWYNFGPETDAKIRRVWRRPV